MAFDPDTQFMLVLDATKGSVNYSQDLQFLIDLGQASKGFPKKNYVTLGGAGNTEENVQSGIVNYKERTPQIPFIAYGLTQKDMSNGSLQNAINNGDFSLVNLVRFNQPSIRDVDTTNDRISVQGDQTRRMKSGNTIVIDGSTGNDGVYVIDTISYDSGTGYTDITVTSGTIDDTTVDGQINDGVKTVVEQKVWLEEYVFDGRIGEEYTLRGQEYEDSVSGGRRGVVKQAGIERNADNPFAGRGQIKLGEGFNVGST